MASRPKIPRGRFVVFEGPNFSGKGRLLSAVEAAMPADRAPLCVREPGGTVFGEKMRAVLKDPAHAIGPYASALLFNACRAELCREVIEPALAAGTDVFSDRYFPSTEVFQITLGELSRGEAAALRVLHRSFPLPDLTIFLLPTSDTLSSRAALSNRSELDRFEGNPRELHAYEQLADDWSRRTDMGAVLILRPFPHTTPETLAREVLARLESLG